MATRTVLDSFSLIAFLENADRGEKIGAIFKRARDKDYSLFVSAVTWADVSQAVATAGGDGNGPKALQAVETLPLEIVPVDREMAEMAASIKMSTKLSLVDCFAVSLAKLRRATLVTGNSGIQDLKIGIDIELV